MERDDNNGDMSNESEDDNIPLAQLQEMWQGVNDDHGDRSYNYNEAIASNAADWTRSTNLIFDLLRRQFGEL